MKVKIFVAVECLMLLVFGVICRSMYQFETTRYETGITFPEYTLSDKDMVNRYCIENGIKQYDAYNQSPDEVLAKLYEKYVDDAAYIIARCYDENKKVIREGGDMVEMLYTPEDKEDMEWLYTYPAKYFSEEQMQNLHEFEEKYGCAYVKKIEGYYDKDQFVLTYMELEAANVKDKWLKMKTEDSHKSITYQGNIYGLFSKTEANKRPTIYNRNIGEHLVEYLADRYAASRENKIKKYNEYVFSDEVESGLELPLDKRTQSEYVEWIDGIKVMYDYEDFIYNGKTYYLGYSVAIDQNYKAMAESNLPIAFPTIFFFLQVAAIGITIIVYITYKKQKRLDEAKIVLTNGVAHELKTPLAVIKSCGECIRENVNVEKNSEYLNSMMIESDKMNRMVIDMLNYTKFSSQRYKLKKELFALDEIVLEVLKEKESLIKQKSIQVCFNYEGSMEKICDGKLIKMVIQNYITNAIQHTPENKSIEVMLKGYKRRFRRKISCYVSNEGSYLTEDQYKKVWDVYYRGDKARSRKENSTGFGLAICKHIIKLHKGKYGCHFADNRMTFYFTI